MTRMSLQGQMCDYVEGASEQQQPPTPPTPPEHSYTGKLDIYFLLLFEFVGKEKSQMVRLWSFLFEVRSGYFYDYVFSEFPVQILAALQPC